MRCLWVNPLTFVIAGSCAMLVADWTLAPFAFRPALLVLGVGLLAAELAMVPLSLARASDSAAMTQAALVATMLHLFCFVGVAAVALLKLSPPRAFTYWLLGSYCLSLILVVVACVRAVRSAAVPKA